MSYAQKSSVTVTTESDGTATAYSPQVHNGRVVNVIYAKTDYADTVDFTITSEDTGQTIWTESDVTASKTVSPTQATHTTVGVAATYDGTRAVLGPVFLVNERLKIVLAAGGDAKTGTFTVIVA